MGWLEGRTEKERRERKLLQNIGALTKTETIGKKK